jgi:hypothetical protein
LARARCNPEVPKGATLPAEALPLVKLPSPTPSIRRRGALRELDVKSIRGESQNGNCNLFLGQEHTYKYRPAAPAGARCNIRTRATAPKAHRQDRPSQGPVRAPFKGRASIDSTSSAGNEGSLGRELSNRIPIPGEAASRRAVLRYTPRLVWCLSRRLSATAVRLAHVLAISVPFFRIL